MIIQDMEVTQRYTRLEGIHTDLDIHRIDQTRGAYESTLCMNIHETNVRMMDVKSTSDQANGTIFYFIKYHVT